MNMSLKSYTQLRDDEDSLKRKRTALTNIMRSLFKVRFLVLSAAALLTLCVFVPNFSLPRTKARQFANRIRSLPTKF